MPLFTKTPHLRPILTPFHSSLLAFRLCDEAGKGKTRLMGWNEGFQDDRPEGRRNRWVTISMHHLLDAVAPGKELTDKIPLGLMLGDGANADLCQASILVQRQGKIIHIPKWMSKDFLQLSHGISQHASCRRSCKSNPRRGW